MARHDQHAIPKGTVCPSCKVDNCGDCVDVPRSKVGLVERNGPLCQCKRKSHHIDAA